MRIRLGTSTDFLSFPRNEERVLIGILKAVYTISKAEFIKQALEGIEERSKPKLLSFTNHYHLCCSCYRDVDDRHPDTLHVVTENENVYKHRVCPPLKEDSTRER